MSGTYEERGEIRVRDERCRAPIREVLHAIRMVRAAERALTLAQTSASELERRLLGEDISLEYDSVTRLKFWVTDQLEP